jgi:uncharacterized membrane protein
MPAYSLSVARALVALAALDVFLLLWAVSASVAENSDSWTMSQAAGTIAFISFVVVFVAFWVLVGVYVERLRQRNRQRD